MKTRGRDARRALPPPASVAAARVRTAPSPAPRARRQAWSDEQLDLLREVWPARVGRAEVERLFPGRRYETVAAKASRMHISAEREWSSPELRRLMDLCGRGRGSAHPRSFATIRRAFPGRTAYALRKAIRRHGLAGKPQGMVTVAEAARRMGYDNKGGAQRILAWARVTIHRIAAGSRPSGARPRGYVDLHDALQAARSFCEFLKGHGLASEAARAHKVSETALRARLRASKAARTTVGDRGYYAHADLAAAVRFLKPRRHRKWTPRQDARVVEMLAAGASHAKIARALQRTRGEVRAHVSRAGLAAPGRRRAAWSAAEKDRLRSLVAQGASEGQLAEAFPGRPLAGVTKARARYCPQSKMAA